MKSSAWKTLFSCILFACAVMGAGAQLRVAEAPAGSGAYRIGRGEDGADSYTPLAKGHHVFSFGSGAGRIEFDPDAVDLSVALVRQPGTAGTYVPASTFYILGIRTGTTAEGTFVIRDTETGETVTSRFYSGGKPYGEFAPEGSYDILSPNKDGHYRLEALDSKYGDDKVAGTDQSLLRLHETGRGRSFGCVSILGDDSWEAIDSLLSRTSTSEVEVDSKSRNPLKWGSKEPETRYGSLEIVMADDRPTTGACNIFCVNGTIITALQENCI